MRFFLLIILFLLVGSDYVLANTSKAYERIISFYPAHTENIVYLGGADKIVGVGRSDLGIGKQVKRFSYRDDPERILSVRPDLVLVRPMIMRAYPHLVSRLRASGVEVISLQPTTVDEIYSYWQALGDLVGKRDLADMMVSDFRKELDIITKKTDMIAPNSRKKVYFEAMHSKMKTFAPESIQMFVLRSAGGINIASDAAQVRKTNIAYYGKEHIISKADEIDIYLAQKGRMNPINKSDILNEPGFNVIKAVRQNKVYIISEHLVSRPTMKLIKGINEIYKILYLDPVPKPVT